MVQPMPMLSFAEFPSWSDSARFSSAPHGVAGKSFPGAGTQGGRVCLEPSDAHVGVSDQSAAVCPIVAGACAGGLRKQALRRRGRGSKYVSRPSVCLHAAASSIQEQPFGSWESPITARFITTAGVGLGSLKCKPDGTLLWLEGRPQEGGRQVVCRRASEDEVKAGKASERGGVDFTPEGSNVRTRVHEYGGGASVLGPDGDGVIYSNFMDQRLYWAKEDGTVFELTPKSAYEQDTLFRFADAVVDVARNRLICVREDHTNPKPSEVVNTICAVALDGSGAMEVLAEGSDFYAAPRVSPDGTQLAYICWDHPNMPWDATELRLATLDPSTGRIAETASVCGSAQPTSVLQPAWSPAGELHFVSDSTGWWNVYKYTAGGETVNLYPTEAEFSGAAPGWALGGQNFCFLPDGRVVLCYKDPITGSARIVLIPGDAGEKKSGGLFGFFGGGSSTPDLKEYGDECLPKLMGGFCPSPDGKTLYFLGGDPFNPAGIYEWSIPEPDTESPSRAQMIVCSMSSDMSIDPGYISAPKLLEFPTGGGAKAYGYYYAPANANFTALAGSKPPLLVKAHGGPTACTGVSLNPGIQFWTSRGFAVLDVDYRGSTGYGRAYRESLKGKWGVVDIEDVCAGAQFLVQEGLADPAKLAIDGGSAGGFTTLGALAFKDVFTAGCSLYGVADLAALAGDTHKFESRYLDGLVGRYPEDSQIYDERAPIKHVDKLSCPILLLQGAEDKIVPPNQAETMYEAVKAQGLPCALKIYEGEQHGFRRSENIEDALNSELLFYARVFGFDAAGDNMPKLVVTNLDPEVAAEQPQPTSDDSVRDLLLQ